jgi:hypothetical protein
MDEDLNRLQALSPPGGDVKVFGRSTDGNSYEVISVKPQSVL